MKFVVIGTGVVVDSSDVISVVVEAAGAAFKVVVRYRVGEFSAIEVHGFKKIEDAEQAVLRFAESANTPY